MKDRKSKKELNKIPVRELQQAILKLFKSNPGKNFSASLIIQILKVGNNRDSVKYALDQLETSGQLKAIGKVGFSKTASEGGIVEKQNNIIKAPTLKHTDSSRNGGTFDGKRAVALRGTHEGKVDMTKTGAAYIVCADLEDDVFVHSSKLNGALNGDTVRIEIHPAGGRRRRAEGEVVQVLTRSTDQFIGVISKKSKYAVVFPDNETVPEILVELEDIKEANEGDKVVVRITKWLSRANRRLSGIVTAVLGKPGTSDIEMKSILISSGFNIEFPEDVLAEAEKIKDNIASEVSKRRDFRGITTFTIDPHDAKDFDDALSYQILENGNTEIGVHIADVAHYILPDTALDKEAYLRSTSVYLVDRVCPMLPERLSNELCSLRPNEDKLTFSAVFEFDETHKIVNKWFGRTIIHSNRRYSYEEAQEILEQGEGDYADELMKLNLIAHSLRKKRFKDGAINFETEEVKFRLDEQGVPIEVYVKVRKDTNLLIEDFMLLANRSVAEYMAKKDSTAEVPYLYRIHDLPNMDKLQDFALFARELGIKMNLDTPEHIAKSLNELVKKAEKDETLKLLMPIAIRTMAKAVYSTDNIGHYGLAFEYYSHFTSPIRRYSDVLAHRILFENLKKINRFDKESLELRCKHISAQERKAADAERQSIKYKQVEFMKNHIGETFDGVISGMIERGVFIEVKGIMAEGMVGFDKMMESFELESNRLRARGNRTGKILKMGDAVRVKIIDADLEKRQIEMVLVD
jgi:ribonuclease R